MINIIYKESSCNGKIDLIKERIEYIKEIYNKSAADITDKEIEITDKLKKLYQHIGDISECDFQKIENEIDNIESYISSVLEKQHKKEFIAMFAAIKPIKFVTKDSSSKQVDKPKSKIIDPINKSQNKIDLEFKSKKNQNSKTKESINIVKSITKLVTSIKQQIKNVTSSDNDLKRINNDYKQQDSLNIKTSRNDKKEDIIKIDRSIISNHTKRPVNKIIDNLSNKHRNFVESTRESTNSKMSSRKIDPKSLSECNNCDVRTR